MALTRHTAHTHTTPPIPHHLYHTTHATLPIPHHLHHTTDTFETLSGLGGLGSICEGATARREIPQTGTFQRHFTLYPRRLLHGKLFPCVLAGGGTMGMMRRAGQGPALVQQSQKPHKRDTQSKQDGANHAGEAVSHV